MRRRDLPLAVCLLLSGAAGLVLQVAWADRLALVLGAAEVAIVGVVAATMGGLALGAWLGGRVRRRLDPGLGYATAEVATGIGALLVPWLTRGVVAVEEAVGASSWSVSDSAASPFWHGFEIVAAMAVLALPTVAMGAALPLLAPAVAGDGGRRLGMLYACNTLGAAGGALLAGWVLLPRLGQVSTEVAAAAMHFVAGMGGWLCLGGRSVEVEVQERGPSAPRMLVVALAIGSVGSFVLEILWSRLLAHLLGSALDGFATMLATFLLGLALGAAVAGALRSASRALVVVEVAAAVVGLAAFVALDELGGRLAPGAVAASSRVALAVGLLLPTTVLVGATVPLGLRVAAAAGASGRRAAGQILAASTLGAVVGSFLASFVVLPWGGFAGGARVAAGAAVLAAGLCAWRFDRRLGWLPPAAAAALLLPLPRQEALVRRIAYGAFGTEAGPIVSLESGRSATVLVVDRGVGWRIATNGLPESLVSPPGVRLGRLPTAFALGALPSAVRSDVRSLFMVGFGGGVALEHVPATVTTIRVAEIEPAVLAANRLLAPLRGRDPLADPRLDVVLADARAVLRREDRVYDAVVSQPSHPWTAAGAHLYSVGFFELVRERLAPRGVFVQWMGLGFVDAELLRSIAASLRVVFPEVVMVQLDAGSVLFLGSAAPLEFGSDPEPRAWWAEVGVLGARDLADSVVLGGAGLDRFAAGAPTLEEDRNILRFRSAGLDPGERLDAASLANATAAYDTFQPDAEVPPRLRRLLDRGLRARARALARALSAQLPAGREAQEVVALLTGEVADRAAGQAERVRAGSPELVAAWLRAHRGLATQGRRLEIEAALDLGPRAVLEAWRSPRPAGDQRRRLLAELEAVALDEPLGLVAALERARLLAHEPAQREVAAALARRALGSSAGSEALAVAAEIEIARGNTRAAASLLAEAVRPGAPWPPALRRLRDQLPAQLADVESGF
jgi:spermidine synthase